MKQTLVKTLVYFKKPYMQKLDYLAYRTRKSKSELIRELINSKETLDDLFNEVSIKYGNHVQIDEI